MRKFRLNGVSDLVSEETALKVIGTDQGNRFLFFILWKFI